MLPHAAKVWGGLVLGIAALDIYCDLGDPNGDTFTEQICLFLDRIPGGRRVLFPAACIFVPTWFYSHIEDKYDVRLEILRSVYT